MRHPDWDDPTRIEWLCNKCHGAAKYKRARARAEASKKLASIIEKYTSKD